METPLQIDLGEKLETLEPLGSPLQGEPVHLILDRVLSYFEGTLLSLYRNPAGEPYLEMWADCGKAYERWLVFRTTEGGLAQYLGQKVSLRTLLTETPDGYVFVRDVDRTDKSSWALLPVGAIPTDIIPMDGMYDPELEPKDAVGSQVLVRKANLEDAVRLHVLGAIIPELKVSSQEEWMTLKEVREAVLCSNGEFLVAEVDDTRKGLVGFSYALVGDLDRGTSGRDTACLVYLAVRPNWREQGIARRLYEEVCTRLKGRGVSYVYAWACPSSGVVDLLEKQGWKSGRTCTWMDRQI